MVGYNQARKLTEIPFPFPYAQLVLMFLVVYALSLPFVVVAWVETRAAIACFSFFPVWAYFSVNEVNRQLEEPFLHAPNDLPCPAFQRDFNKRLSSLSFRRPDGGDASFFSCNPRSGMFFSSLHARNGAGAISPSEGQNGKTTQGHVGGGLFATTTVGGAADVDGSSVGMEMMGRV